MIHQAPDRESPIEVHIVERCRLYREAIRLLVESDERFVVAGVHATCDELPVDCSGSHLLVLVSCDLESRSPDLDAVAVLAARAKLVVLCADPNAETQLRAARLGATGLVGKDQTPAVLLKALAKVHEGEAWFDRTTIATVISGIGAPEAPTAQSGSAAIGRLTRREREVIVLVARGLKNREIGEILFISDATVRHHLTSIFSKLEVSDRLELLIFAYRHGLATPGP